MDEAPEPYLMALREPLKDSGKGRAVVRFSDLNRCARGTERGLAWESRSSQPGGLRSRG